MDSGASGPRKKLAAEALTIGDAIVNGKAFDVPPPGAGLNTVTKAVPGELMSTEEIVATNSVGLTNVVERVRPFHLTSDVCTKLVPLTVNANVGLPTTSIFLLRLVKFGIGFGGKTVNISGLEVPPPGDGEKTVIVPCPTFKRSLSLKTALS